MSNHPPADPADPVMSWPRWVVLPFAFTAIMTMAAGCAVPPAGPLPSDPAASTALDTRSTAPNRDDGVGATTSAPATPEAVATAVVYVTAWARPDLDPRRWNAGVTGWVVPGYASLLADTDPANVPARAVTGTATVVSSTTAVVVVAVPTDAGPVHVTLVAIGGRWLVAAASPSRP